MERISDNLMMQGAVST